jgi:hypothetical protein
MVRSEHLALLNDLGTLETLHLRQKSADLDIPFKKRTFLVVRVVFLFA